MAICQEQVSGAWFGRRGQESTSSVTARLDVRTEHVAQPPDPLVATKSPSPRSAAPRFGAEAEVGAAVDGDSRAIGRLLAIIRPLVVRYCRGRVGSREQSYASADDVAQEVCLAVFKALPTYRDQGRPFLAFVFGIAAHKVADAHRSAARNRSEPVPELPETPETEAGPEQRAVEGDLSQRMALLLGILSAKQREIVLLRVVVGLSAEETADAVGSTPGAVRVAQHRALARLRTSLDQYSVQAAAHEAAS
jgi:RNA polymerase sigma-70 factor (ECF subfamily)